MRKPARSLGPAGFLLYRDESLLDIAWALLAVALACKSFLGAALLTWFQVERVPLDFFHDVFLLNLAFKAAQRTLKSFALLQMDFCQLEIHHLPVTLSVYRDGGVLCCLGLVCASELAAEQMIRAEQHAGVEQVGQ